MANFNKVMLLGHLTRDPLNKATLSGTIICEMGIAVNRRFRSAQGEDREEVCYVELEAFGRTAEICAQYLRKGSQVFFEGRLRLDQWVDKNTNQNRSRLKVVVEAVQLLGPRATNQQFAAPGNDNTDYYPQDAPPNAYAQPPGAYQQPATQYSHPAYQQAPPANQRYQPPPPQPAYQSQAPPPTFPPPPSPQPPATAFPPPPGSLSPTPPAPPASPAPAKGKSVDEVADNTYEPIPPPGAPAAPAAPPPANESASTASSSEAPVDDVPF